MIQSPRDIFNKISYLQYLFVMVSGYFYIRFMMGLIDQNIDWDMLNKVLIFYGISISLSTLQDTTKTQNKFSKRVWEDPKKGKWAIGMIFMLACLFILLGIAGVLKSQESIHKEVSMGLVVLGIGLVGMLKAAIEMFEHHRLDKHFLN